MKRFRLLTRLITAIVFVINLSLAVSSVPASESNNRAYISEELIDDYLQDIDRNISNDEPLMVELIPGRYPDTVSLNEVLRNLAGTNEGENFVLDIIDQIETTIETEIPDSLVNKILNNLELVTNLLQFDHKMLSVVNQSLMLLGPLGSPGEIDYGYQLGKTFNYSKITNTQINLPSSELQEITPGLYTGWPKNPQMSDKQMKANIVFAEVIERLANNINKPKANKFMVIFRGKRYTALDRFIHALSKTNHIITAEIEHRVADFAGLFTMGTDGEFKPVAASIFIKTGILDTKGNEAKLPVFHSEIVFSVKPKNNSVKGSINASAKYYQGTEKTGFYGNECAASQKWEGESISKVFGPKSAIRALKLSGLLVNVIRAASKNNHLPQEGYGATGVCNDSVAIIQCALTGNVFPYPLVMNDDLLIPELKIRLKKLRNNRKKRKQYNNYKSLLRAVNTTPSDFILTDTTAIRALLSMPWEEGYEPFYSVVEAREILNKYITDN